MRQIWTRNTPSRQHSARFGVHYLGDIFAYFTFVIKFAIKVAAQPNLKPLFFDVNKQTEMQKTQEHFISS